MNFEYEQRLLQSNSAHISSCDSSPRSPKVKKFYGDRFIPCRASKNWQTNFSLQEGTCSGEAKKSKGVSSDCVKDGVAYSCLLKNELLGTTYEDIREKSEHEAFSLHGKNQNLFSYCKQDCSIVNEATSQYSISPVSSKSQKLLQSPRKGARKITKIPYKVLDAPDLQDDFYLNLVDWSSTNILSVGLGASVYLWSACTSHVTRLCDLSSDGDAVTSVSWAKKGHLVAVGTNKGYVQVWDVSKNKIIFNQCTHSARVGVLAWNGDILCSGSRDRQILEKDIRTPCSIYERKLIGHQQEVCGLKWSPDNQHLASGGNDNKLFIWNRSGEMPIQTYAAHLAAVKAIAWSPHSHGLLASGGGTADRCIRFWNTLTTNPVQCIDTGSQVCNLAWSKHASELVSTHGYSQNQIVLWRYPSMTPLARLTGHSYRVLYLATSPDGESIVTGAGDETLRFWNIFSKVRSQKEAKSAVNLFTSIR